MRRLALPVLLALTPPAQAEAPNLAPEPDGTPGTATRLVLAQRTYEAAMTNGDAILLLAAIRLARSVTPRPPTAWEKTTTGDAPGDEAKGRPAAPDPAGPEAIAIAQGLAGEDPDLQDLVYDLDAQLPDHRTETAVTVSAELGAGQTDSWRMPLFGEVAAEIGLIGDGDGPLALTVTDEGGTPVCALPPSTAPALCRLTPARNGFFTVSVSNPGTMVNTYRLIGN
ncbi:hypothetical protein [Tabrizicola sp.]|uniref:hypothetical protein n=1 Tax=Tabrizicola sp. TaxID=2005166 RepID=UPI003F3D491D